MSNFWTAAEAREHTLFAVNTEAQKQQIILGEIYDRIKAHAKNGLFNCCYFCPKNMAEWAKEYLESKYYKVTDFESLNGMDVIFFINWENNRNDSTKPRNA